MDIIPGLHRTDGHSRSCLTQAFGEDQVLEYDPMCELPRTFYDASSDTVVVHDRGFFAFWYAYTRKPPLFSCAKRLIVLDGWLPLKGFWLWNNERVRAPTSLPKLPSLYFFSTNSRGSVLESMVRNEMVTRNDILIARGIGFGFNLLHSSFDVEKLRLLVPNLDARLKQKIENGEEKVEEVVVHFPEVDVKEKTR